MGVGATVPDSAGPSGREVAQLKNKLTGQKRRRDTRDADLDTKTNGVANSRNKSEDSDEEESRVTAIRKKAKVDPFEKKTKKKKKKEMDGSGAVNANEDPTMVSGKGKENEKAEQIVTNLFDVPSFGTDKMENGEEDKMDVDAGGSFLRDGVIESGQGGDQKPGDGGGLGEGKKRKKRKKKHRDGEVRGTTTNSGEGSQTDGLVLGKSNAAGTGMQSPFLELIRLMKTSCYSPHFEFDLKTTGSNRTFVILFRPSPSSSDTIPDVSWLSFQRPIPKYQRSCNLYLEPYWSSSRSTRGC